MSTIDQILTEDLARWNDGSPLGTPVVLTYSFPTYLAPDAEWLGVQEFRPLTEAQADDFRLAMSLWDNVTPGIKLIELSGADAVDAAIRIASYSTRNGIPTGIVNDGEAFLPNDKWSPAGDIFINHTSHKNSDLSLGTDGFRIAVHEIGHALGLIHPEGHDADGTIMSYNFPDPVTGPASLDIAAVNYLYGAAEAEDKWLLAGPGGGADAGFRDARLVGTWLDEYVVDLGDSATIDLRGGLDSFHASGLRDEWAIEIAGAHAQLQRPGFDPYGNSIGMDTIDLRNVERIHFEDGTIAFDVGVGDTAGSVYRTYQAAFDRTPDAAGLSFWVEAADEGASLTTIAQGFLDSSEFTVVYGANATNEEYVDRLYENVLGRDGELDGFAFWTELLNSGSMSRADVLAGFAESFENVTLVATAIDDGIWYG